MSAQRTIAVLMILVGSVLTAWASADIAFPAILCMLALLGTEGRFTWDIRPERKFITPLLLLLLAILFAIHCRYAHVRNDEAATFAWATIARYFLASTTLLLFLRPPSQLPPSLGLFHLANVMAAGQALLLEDIYIGFRFAELLGVTLVVLYAVVEPGSRREMLAVPSARIGARRSHSRFHTWHVILLVIALNVGWLGGSLLYRNVELFNVVPAWIFRTGMTLEAVTEGVSRVGFSGSGRLGSVFIMMTDEDLEPVLTVESDGSPGYLRARVFEVYRSPRWSDLSYRDAMYPEQNALGTLLVARMNLFRLNDEKATRRMTIRHESPLGDAMFSPLGTCSVEAPFTLLMRDDDEVVSAPNTRSSLAYRVAAASPVRGPRPAGAHFRRMMNIPVNLDPRIEELAAQVFAGSTTTAEKIEAVVDHFRRNYTYQLGLDVPLERDNIEYFLLEAETGYCEYFASGAAILLRLAGVPTRYVTGFLVTERAEDGQSWIARNMDAHAWVEAWDRDRNEWTIVEATAQSDLLDGSLADQLANKGPGGRLLLRQLARSLYDYGLFGIITWFFDSYTMETAVVVSLAFAGGALWLALFRRYTRSRGRALSRSGRGPDFAALHRLLTIMDRKVRAIGLRRSLDETLHAFAQRIRAEAPPERRGREIADWYLAYADLRYRPSVSAERLEDLREQARHLRRSRL